MHYSATSEAEFHVFSQSLQPYDLLIRNSLGSFASGKHKNKIRRTPCPVDSIDYQASPVR
ncbi:hypothetical protein MARINON1_50145 [Marinobacter salarius]|nr:hypothetical protein MBHK15_120146 [Marinobacter salarius]VXB33729.1 hypothetical protein MARINON1_50145 [Marinobacter salarius]